MLVSKWPDYQNYTVITFDTLRNIDIIVNYEVYFYLEVLTINYTRYR